MIENNTIKQRMINFNRGIPILLLSGETFKLSQ